MSRKPPSTQEVIDAIKDAMAGYHSVARFEDIRLGTQRRLKTVASSARTWMYEALTEPGQDELVLLHSSDNKFVGRVQYEADSDRYTHFGDLHDGPTLLLYLNNRGDRVDLGDGAARNVTWVMRKSVLDAHIAELLKQEAEKDSQRAQEQALKDAKTEAIIGTELSMIRGMLAAAGIELSDRTLTAWALRVDKGEGKTARRARATIGLNAKQLVLFAKWLMDQNIEPVAANQVQEDKS